MVRGVDADASLQRHVVAGAQVITQKGVCGEQDVFKALSTCALACLQHLAKAAWRPTAHGH